MSKINWDIYARRRRINFEKLLAVQNIKSYSDYLAYCVHINVNPMLEEDFPLSSSTAHKPAPAPKVLPPAQKKVAAPKATQPKKTQAPKKLKHTPPAKDTDESESDRWGISSKKPKTKSKKADKKSSK
jgi:hypothetical protein